MDEIKPKSIGLNLLLRTIRLFMGMALPVIVFPYVARVLGPEKIGKVDFVTSVVNYFVLFAALGIPTYGIIEVAKVRENKEQLSRTVFELVIILFITNIVIVFFYFIMFFSSSLMEKDRILYLVVFPTILLNSFCFEWFYVGIEDQVFITIRYSIVKILQIVLIYLFVKEESDYILYATILVGANGIASVFNICRLRKYISFKFFSKLSIVHHLKPIFIIFASEIAINIYLQLDITMVGIIVDENAVGLYTTANKIIRVIISIVTAIGSVMIPRLTNNLQNNQIEEYRTNLSKSLNFILLLACPFMFGTIAIADDFVVWFAGIEFSQAGLSMKLLSPIIVIVGLANFVGLQILYSNKKEWIYTVAVSVAAVVNFITNSILIPIYQQNGAVIGTIVAESIGLLVMSLLGREYLLESKVLSWKLLGYLFCSIIMYCCMKITNYFISSILIISLVGVISYFLLILIYFRIIGVTINMKKRIHIEF